MPKLIRHQQILEDAIAVAIAGGWAYWLHEGFASFVVYTPVDMLNPLVRFQLGEHSQVLNYQAVIFDHSFAKALWGNQPILTRPDTYGQLTRVHMGLPVQKPEPSRLEALLVEACRYHLQRMVVAKDAIVYLGENI